MAINSPEDICNLALGHLGITKTVTNIVTGRTDIDKICGLWYELSREKALKVSVPNFALARVNLAVLDEEPSFGWTNAIEYPSNCLKVLGFGEVETKKNNYSVEGDRIYTNLDGDVLELRYIKNIKDVSKFSPEFKEFLSYVVADNICMSITQGLEKKNYINALLRQKLSECSSMNAQENPPVRISYSKFRASRYGGNPKFTEKL